jgi:ribosomal protein S18 acetylase RimI-like enzyme
MTFVVRPFHLSDLPALYRICLLTGDNGNDASALFRDPELLGHLYAAPYGLFEPALAFVLTDNGAPCGYVLGAADTAAFFARCEAEWFPALRARYALPDPADRSPDANLSRSIHTVHTVFPERAPYRAHLHIDLLPQAQGAGWGRRMMTTLLNALRKRDVPGVSLGVSPKNTRAIGFYTHLGFHQIESPDGRSAYGLWF